MQHFSEQRALSLRAPDFQGCVPASRYDALNLVVCHAYAEVADDACVTAIEPISDSEKCGADGDNPPARGRKLRVILVFQLGWTFPVIAGDVGDDADFIGGELLQVAVLDQVLAVLVVRLSADVPA